MCSDKTDVEETLARDGRRQRSERNRQKIIAAMFELIREGDFDPSVARIAERAGVGLRTVFRHFEDVDSLYREMAARLETDILPEIQKPLTSTDWQGRVLELMERRIGIFEEIMPLRICANARRFRSDFLMAGYQRFVQIETVGLARALPPEILSDDALVAAFDVALCFETWRRLRQDRGYSFAKATITLKGILDTLMATAA